MNMQETVWLQCGRNAATVRAEPASNFASSPSALHGPKAIEVGQAPFGLGIELILIDAFNRNGERADFQSAREFGDMPLPPPPYPPAPVW